MTMRPYYTILIPPVSPERATEWHGDVTLTRGAFDSQLEAQEWAEGHLNENPYEIMFVDPDESKDEE